MKGTMKVATLAMRFMPPSTTRPTSTARVRPVAQVGTPKLSLRPWATELACTVLPMPKPAIMPNTANSSASQAQFSPRPLRM